INVLNPAPGGGLSATLGLNIQHPVPVLASVFPRGILLGGPDFMLTAQGLGFVRGSVVEWNGTSRATTYVSSTTLMATITAADINQLGTAEISVLNPPPGGGRSSVLVFTIGLRPVPAISSILPSVAQEGSPDTTMRVVGEGFVADSKVRWNDSVLDTSFVNAGQLRAVIPATQLSHVASNTITVLNPPPGDEVSNALSFVVVSRTTVANAAFGMHIHDPNTLWPGIPIGSIRLWDSGTSWDLLEPRRGNWNFTNLD